MLACGCYGITGDRSCKKRVKQILKCNNSCRYNADGSRWKWYPAQPWKPGPEGRKQPQRKLMEVRSCAIHLGKGWESSGYKTERENISFEVSFFLADGWRSWEFEGLSSPSAGWTEGPRWCIRCPLLPNKPPATWWLTRTTCSANPSPAVLGPLKMAREHMQ